MSNASSLRIIFMGTPEFAVSTLNALLQAGCNIITVITAPDKPAGRGMKMQESAVKKAAVAAGIPVLQPEKLKSPEFLEQLRNLNADLQVIVAFRMLPEVVWSMPRMGSFNLHASLLPQYRGAAPINWAIINGETETGLTTFQLRHEIDTGNILMQERIPIGPDETAGELHDRMKAIGGYLVVKTVEGLADGSIQGTEQPQPDEIKDAPKIYSETCAINAFHPRQEVHNFVRGLSPFPGAFTYLDAHLLKVFRSKIPESEPECHPKPGEIIACGKQSLYLGCLDGPLELLEIQMEGKKRMNTGDFLRGYRPA